ncbi:Protein of unknown function [Pyronema omphalodes CBS 100304]|uniref:Uncharacterized protein n=1 Tax=Pyronema omphalodes (strain CBS 100304) TaxID=1076935 RepID=U4LDJ3_PYROM|nr:Protein of unknown function [Pyronema omphalodes CBS 100304]
MRVILDPT